MRSADLAASAAADQPAEAVPDPGDALDALRRERLQHVLDVRSGAPRRLAVGLAVTAQVDRQDRVPECGEASTHLLEYAAMLGDAVEANHAFGAGGCPSGVCSATCQPFSGCLSVVCRSSASRIACAVVSAWVAIMLK